MLKFRRIIAYIIAITIIISLTIFALNVRPKPVAHIYIDVATASTLLQMINLTNTPATDPKLIGWRRFPNLHTRIDLQTINATEISLPHSELETKATIDLILAAFKDFYSKHPDMNYEIHCNLFWGNILIPILQQIPKKQIKRLHLYEDGIGNTIYSRSLYTQRQSTHLHLDTKLRQVLAEQIPYDNLYMFSFHKIYPTTYYFSFVDIMHTYPDFDDFFKYLKGAKIVQTNFDGIIPKLTDNQKEMIYRMTGFDKDAYKKQINGRYTKLFITDASPHFIDHTDYADLCFDRPADQDSVLVLKLHPAYPQYVCDIIAKKIPNAVILPNNLPFELLIIADLMPDQISGYSSSILLSVPFERIGKIIAKHNDFNLPLLDKLHPIAQSQIIMKE